MSDIEAFQFERKDFGSIRRTKFRAAVSPTSFRFTPLRAEEIHVTPSNELQLKFVNRPQPSDHHSKTGSSIHKYGINATSQTSKELQRRTL